MPCLKEYASVQIEHPLVPQKMQKMERRTEQLLEKIKKFCRDYVKAQSTKRQLQHSGPVVEPAPGEP